MRRSWPCIRELRFVSKEAGDPSSSPGRQSLEGKAKAKDQDEDEDEEEEDDQTDAKHCVGP